MRRAKTQARAFPLVAAALLAAAPAAALADAVVLKNRLRYEPVTVEAVADGVIAFRLGSGRMISKSLTEVATVKIDGENDFNRGEDLLIAGKYVEAVAAYGQAEKAAAGGWKKRLVRYRLLSAAEAAGDIEVAVKRWLAVVDAADASKGSLALRPRKLAPARSGGNDRAIKLLKAKADLVSKRAYRGAILELLVDLYERQGRLAEARALAAQLAGKASDTAPGPGRQPRQRPPGSNGADLRLARLSLKARRHREVLGRLQPRLKSFSAAELPFALYLLGAAQLELSRTESDAVKARALLLAGGLNVMRVVALFPESEEAPDALLLAGEVNEWLKNPEAARSAYSELISRRPKSPQARKAKAALERLRGGT